MPTNDIAAATWPSFGVDRVFPHPEREDVSLELGFRFAALQVGYWLGWASIVVVLVGLALDGSVPHRSLLIGATLAAAAGNTVAMVIPWREWLATRSGKKRAARQSLGNARHAAGASAPGTYVSEA